MEEDSNEKPTYDSMDFDISLINYSPSRALFFDASFDYPSLMPPSPQPGFSLWNFSDGNASSSTQPLVLSPSLPSRERLRSSKNWSSSKKWLKNWSKNWLDYITGWGELEELVKFVLVQEFARLYSDENRQELEELFLVQELAKLRNKNRELHKFIQHASQVTLEIKINTAPEICEGHDNASIESLDRVTLVANTFKLHFVWTKASCRYRSLANGGDLKKSCTSFDGCYMHQDCMSTAKLEIYVDFCVENHIESGQGVDGRALSSHSPFFCRDLFEIEYPLVQYAREIGSQSFHAICEPIASAGDQPDSRCELIHISQSTKSPPWPNGLPDREEMLLQDSLKHQLLGENHGMNDGENVLSEGVIHNAVSYPENEGTRKTSKREDRKVKRKITIEDLQRFSGNRMEAAKSFEVSESTIKRLCRKHGITDWRNRRIDKDSQLLSKPKHIIESVQGEGVELGNQMPGGSRSCERELNHEQTGFPPESEEGSDSSQIGVGLMVESSTHMEITPAGDTLVSSTHQCIEAGDPLELPVQPSELNFSAACLRPDAINFTQMDHYISATEAINTEQVPESSRSCSDLAPKLAKATAAHTMPLVTERQDTSIVTMKATYRGDTIRFQLSLTSGIIELRKEVAERLMLEVGTFSIKYLDDENEWILMTGDKDLQECFNISISLGCNVIRLLIDDIRQISGASSKANRGLKRNCIVRYS